MVQKRWSEIDGIACQDMYAAGKRIDEIATTLGRTTHSIDDYLRRHTVARNRQNRAWVKWGERVDRRGLLGKEAPKRMEIPPYVIADRERRANEERTLGQILMGDPPFSQSALARYGASASGRPAGSRES